MNRLLVILIIIEPEFMKAIRIISCLLLVLTSSRAFSNEYIIKFDLNRDFKTQLKLFSKEYENYSKLNGDPSILRYNEPSQIFSDIDKWAKVSKDKVLNAEQYSISKDLSAYFRVNFVTSDDRIQVNSIISFLEELKLNGIIVDFFENKTYKINNLQIPNDALIDEQWGLAAVNAIKSWKLATGKGIKVGVVDTGIDHLHPDIKNQIWINPKEDLNGNRTYEPWSYLEKRNGLTGDFNGLDDDGNGFVDDIIGYDFVDQQVINIGDSRIRDGDPYDEHGHGTLVAGVIAAESNNKIGISGVAYDAQIVSLRAMDGNGNGESDDIASAIVYAALNGVNVLNFSFGEMFDSPLMHEAIKFAYSLGCVMVGSSGNEGWDRRHYPSDYEEVICVGSVNQSLTKDYRSNYGSRLNLVAPGDQIMSLQLYSGYKKFSGTSLAAPFVSSACAMLLEKSPALRPSEILGILESTAMDLDLSGWDNKTAAGILDIDKALNNAYPSSVTISSPPNQMMFNKESTDRIIFNGTISALLFDSYRVLLGRGDNPSAWDTISPIINSQVFQSEIFSLNTRDLADTNYTIKVLVSLKSNTKFEKRLQFGIYSTQKPLKIESAEVSYPFFNKSRYCLINAKTNYPAIMEIDILGEQGTKQTFSRTAQKSIYHGLLLEEFKSFGKRFDAFVKFITDDGDTLSKDFSFEIPADFFPEDKFAEKSYGFGPAYLLNKVRSGKSSLQTVVINDLSAYEWGNMITIGFGADEKFKNLDTLKRIYLPVGYGDTDGDGVDEILALRGGRTILYQGKDQNDYTFSRVLFADTISLNFWGSALADIDGDGRNDIIAYNDTSFMVYSFRNNEYKLIAQTYYEPSKKYISTLPGLSVGDFDADGNIEIAHGNGMGDIFIFKYKNNGFERVFLDTSKYANGQQYFTSADIDGDGIIEIIRLQYGTDFLIDDNDGGNLLWQIQVWKYVNGNYSNIFTDYYYGVRAGLGYRNGISSGDIDNTKGDEILLTLFPNFYALKWDSNSLKPFWYYPSAFSNSSIIHDFDKNGINEFGFCTGSRTAFFEYNSSSDKLDSPGLIEGWAINEHSAFLQWRKSDQAEKTIIYRIIDNQFAEEIAQSDSDSITITDLYDKKEYLFALRSYNSKLNEAFSSFTQSISVFTHKPLEIDTAYFNGKSNQLILKFDGLLQSTEPETDLFILILGIETYKPNITKILSDSTLLLSFNSEIPFGKILIKAESFRDYYLTPTSISEYEFEHKQIENEEYLFLSGLKVINKSTIELVFSEKVAMEEALNVSNYILSPFGTILDIDQTSDDRVIVSLDPKNVGAFGVNYIITVSDVTSLSGKKMSPGLGNSLSFVFSEDGPNNSITYPNPFRLSQDEKMIFAKLPKNAQVHILSEFGELLHVLEDNDGNGGVEWDGNFLSGNRINSGIYIYQIKQLNENGWAISSTLNKFVVIK